MNGQQSAIIFMCLAIVLLVYAKWEMAMMMLILAKLHWMDR